jgi:putative transposase
MSRPIRYQSEERSVFFVTDRCIHSRFLLRPSQRVHALIVGVLARALERFDVKLFGMCSLSNHYHLLLSSKDAATLASSIQYVGSNIAREVGRQHWWRGERLWAPGTAHPAIVLTGLLRIARGCFGPRSAGFQGR